MTVGAGDAGWHGEPVTAVGPPLLEGGRRSLRIEAPSLVVGAVLGATVVYQPLAVGLIVPGVAVVLSLVALARILSPAGEAPPRRWVVTWTLVAFALHLAIGLVILSSSRLTNYFGGDALTYTAGGVGLLQHWLHGAPLPGTSVLPPGKVGFGYLLGALFVGFGPHPQTGLVVNAAMAAAIVPLLSDATRRQFGNGAARPVPVLATLLPGFLIWGSQLLREAGVYFLMAVAMACAVRLVQRSSLRSMLVMVAALGLLVTFRADVGVVMAGALAVAIMIGRRQVAGGLASGLGMIALVAALVLGAGLGYSGYRLITHASLRQVNSIRAGSSVGVASGFLPEASVSNPTHAASYLPLGATYFLFGPAPWQIRGIRQLPALPDALVWWFLLPSLWRGLRAAWRRRGRETLVYVLPALALTAILALLIANFGTAVRERMQVIIILVPLIGLGWSERHPGGQAASVEAGEPTALPSPSASSPAARGQ